MIDLFPDGGLGTQYQWVSQELSPGLSTSLTMQLQTACSALTQPQHLKACPNTTFWSLKKPQRTSQVTSRKASLKNGC